MQSPVECGFVEIVITAGAARHPNAVHTLHGHSACAASSCGCGAAACAVSELWSYTTSSTRFFFTARIAVDDTGGSV